MHGCRLRSISEKAISAFISPVGIAKTLVRSARLPSMSTDRSKFWTSRRSRWSRLALSGHSTMRHCCRVVSFRSGTGSFCTTWRGCRDGGCRSTPLWDLLSARMAVRRSRSIRQRRCWIAMPWTLSLSHQRTFTGRGICGVAGTHRTRRGVKRHLVRCPATISAMPNPETVSTGNAPGMSPLISVPMQNTRSRGLAYRGPAYRI